MCAIISLSLVWKAIFIMIKGKCQRKGIRKWFLGCFFAFMVLLTNFFGGVPGITGVSNVYAEPEVSVGDSSCKNSLGSLGWLVCPSTGKVSEAVDFLYDKIEDVLVINPVKRSDDSPIYQIWRYFQGVTNILFVVFLLVVVFSQITGIGISNYGIKKTLPKLIIAAVLVNLSFYICSLAVDVSNIFGTSLRGLFETIETSVSGSATGMSGVQMSEMYVALAGGSAATVAGVTIAFETGAIWMMIPLALGALVSVVIGLITIAMRQAVVTLLVMVAPLAMVAYILPNTEQWFKKWKQLLFQMLIFYPAFSLLFGASSVAGWAIIISSQNGFTTLIGVAVQIFPLFFSWSLMKMSGTVLGTINSKLTALSSGMVGGVRGWAGSHRDLTRAKNLAKKDVYTPSLRLQQFLSDRKITREEETKEHMETVKNRGLAYAAMRNYKRDGTPSAEGEEAYEEQARNMEYQQIVLRHTNNMDKGLGQLEEVKTNGTAAQKARLNALDMANVNASDELKMEKARGEMIDYENVKGFHERMEAAINYHMDEEHAMIVDEKTGNKVENKKYKRHFDPGSVAEAQARVRYQNLSKIMEGNAQHAQYAAATAAHGYETQKKIMATNMQDYINLTPPTKDVVYRLDELTKGMNASEKIDAIIPGLRVLNQRGDTDLVKEQLDNILNKNVGGGLQLGTHASQSLASFLMFEVKDNDPFLRRFGKYINLETARAYNKNERKNLDFDYDEYIKGYHMELNPATGQLEKMYAKKDMVKLNEGTSLDNVERTAFSNLDDSLKQTYGFDPKNVDKAWDVEGWLKKREEIQTAFEPAFLSASLKWLSGSEQINSAVKFWTGYDQSLKGAWDKVKKDKNSDELVSKYIGFERDKDGNIIGERDYMNDVERYYRRKTNDYFKDQTTGQILGMRTDYRDAAMMHLVDTFLNGLDSEDEMTEEELQMYDERRAEYERKKAEIQTRYGDEDKDVADAKRKKDLKALDMEIAGKQVRKILGETGKLEQIYRTRRSGAANNAKDWLRKWVNLDDEEAMNKEVKYYIELKKDQKKDAVQKTNADGESNDDFRYYDAATRKSCRDELENVYKQDEDVSAEEFYKICRGLIEKWFGGDASLVEWKFRKFYERESKKGHLETYRLKTELEDLLQDPDNYPDA